MSRYRLVVTALRLLVLVVVIVGWQLGSGDPDEGWTLIDEFYVSRPSEIIRAVERWSDEGVLLSAIQITLHETVVGFLIGAGLGLAVGFVLGVSRLMSDVFKPFVTALNSIPRLALVPLFILWFGLGLQSKVALVATIVFFLVFFNTYEGVRDVDRELIDVLRVMRARWWHIHAKVTLPSAMTWIIAGLRVSVPYALVAAVTAEMIASNRGMGYLIVRSSGQFYTAGVFAGIVVLVVMSLVLTGVVALLERWLLRWKIDRLAGADR